MPIFAGGKNISEIFYGTTPIKQAFYGASLVWQKRLSNIAGYEAVTAWLLSKQSVDVNGQRLWRVMEAGEKFAMDVPFENEGRQVQLWALMGDESEVSWIQDGRVCLRARVSGGQLAVESQGNRKAVISYTVAWPGGRHWVMLNSENDWYGYQLGTFIDGARVQYATNGGAFALSERVFMPGTTRLTTSGDVAVVSADWTPFANDVTTIDDFEKMMTLNSLAEQVTTSGEWTELYPGAQIRMWITGGGDRGANGTDGTSQSAGTMGFSGANGACFEIVPALRSGTLTVGRGGDRHSRYSGEPTLFEGFSSANGSSSLVPSAFGWTPTRLGKGGFGGKGGEKKTDDNGDAYKGGTGWPGEAGGLTVIYQWPKP